MNNWWDELDEDYEDLESFEPIERTKMREEDTGPKRKTNKKSRRKAREQKEFRPTLDNDEYED